MSRQVYGEKKDKWLITWRKCLTSAIEKYRIKQDNIFDLSNERLISLIIQTQMQFYIASKLL